MPADPESTQLYLARHGETEWSLSGQHTGTTDIPLTPNGEEQARKLGGRLAGVDFARVWASPRRRAVRTAELAGFSGRVEVVADLAEWNYGAYEGLKTDEIQAQHPGWLIYRDGCPGGESPGEVAARADRVVARIRGAGGRTLTVSHGHFTRILAVRWLGLPVLMAQHLAISTASLAIVGHSGKSGDPVLELWNDHRHAGE